MSVKIQAFKGATWLAIFKFISQMFSWIVTIIVDRILLPEEYGLYAMAILITGYAQKFSQLGLGAAIIQRQDLDKENLSSVFWFSIFISFAAKYILLRSGGLKFLKKSRPFFFGLILGQFVVAGFWSILGITLKRTIYIFTW